MSLTPTNTRMMRDAGLGAGIKLTPTASPFTTVKTNPRSPVKAARAEATLALRTVIGTTTSTANAFDSLPAARCFAYTAGAAAVIATVDDQHNISQRFYRARPTTNPINSSSSVYGGPATPTQNESRNRTAAALREVSLGASPYASPATNDWNDSPNARAWNAREKIRAATCVSFSPDGKFLAVGETGYKPRVLIFSNSADAPSDTPLTALSEHSFGVNCVAFSPDSKYLASIGTAQDGFLYVWGINPRTGAATLHSSNKCVSNINRMIWMGSKLITVGTRHVKVWSLEDRAPVQRVAKPRQSDLFVSSTHKPLSGRNCLLGDLQDSTFTSVCQVAPNKAIVASERGDLCLIDETDREQNFSRVAHAGFSVSSMAVDGKGRLHLAGSHGGLKVLTVASLTNKLTSPPSPSSQGSRGDSPTISITDYSSQISAIACLADHVVTVDSQRTIRLSHLCAASTSEGSDVSPQTASDETSTGDVIHTLPAQGDSVLGVRVLSQPNNLDASYYTWAAGGSVIFWSQTGNARRSLQVALEQPAGFDYTSNELRTVRASSDGSFLVTGDKTGVLRIIDCRFEAVIFESRAHSNEITSIAIFEDESSTLVASASRDRTVQIFGREKARWTLLQTLDEHAGAVLGIQFSHNGTRLVSSSSDRSIVVREMLSREEDGETIRVFVFLRCIAFKSTPVSMTWDVDQDDVLIASSVDRQVHKYDLQSGQCLSNFKASDNDGGDAVVLHSLAHIPREWGSPLIAGVSSTDKSIRVYDESGTLLARDWGHTEGVTDIAFVQPSSQDEDSREKSIVTVAVDGTIFVWGLTLQSPYRQEMSKSMDMLGTSAQSTPSLLATKPPLRRVLSQSEIAKFQRSPDEGGSATPTGNRSPTLKKKFSKYSLEKTQTPKLDPSPLPSSVRERRNGGTTNHTFLRRKNNTSPSPPASPKTRNTQRRASVDVRSKSNLKAGASEYGSLTTASESFCRQLKAYRKRLANSNEPLDNDVVKEVQRELATTARAIGERAKTREFDETVVAKLLDQYSERLVNILDERIAASVALRTRQDSEAALSTPLRSPADYKRSPSPLGENDDTTGGDEDPKEVLTPTTTSTGAAEEVSEQ